MARRKRVMDDDDSDSSNGSEEPDADFGLNADEREERALFADPYQRKRRRKDHKADALYGVFAEDSEDEGFKGGRDRGRAPPPKKSSDWTKAPAFVTGTTAKNIDLDAEMDVDLERDVSEDDSDDDAGEADGSEADDGQVAEDSSDDHSDSPRRSGSLSRGVTEEVAEEQEEPSISRGGLGSAPHRGGIGSSSSMSKGGIGSNRSPPSMGFSKGGIGSNYASTSSFTKGGIGSNRSGLSPAVSSPKDASLEPSDPTFGVSHPSPTPPEEGFPSAFGRNKSFARESHNPSPKPATLSATDMAHLSKMQGSFGARMLAKMGWQAGTGLGAGGEGIVTPVESKLRPQKMGIAFKGFKERTEQAKSEARRKGQVLSDDEDPKARKLHKKAKEQAEKRSDVWKRPKKVKTKVEHKTYEQILSEAGQDAPPPGIGQIIDATGAVPREVSSLADISLNSWSPSNDPTRIPEVRHNIRLIAEACKSDLDGLAREAKSLRERKTWVANEDARLRKKVADEAKLIERLQKVQIVANEINNKSQELSSMYEITLEPFSPLFYQLINEFSREFEKYRLDELVVAAIAPLVRRMVASWNPLEEPTAFISTFKNWRRLLGINQVEEKPLTEVDVYGAKTVTPRPVDLEKPMTPFESLLWNVWLPRVRTSINNEWSPEEPHAAVKLYEAWSTFLPPFIRDNMLDQLILPKVQKAVASWNPKRDQVSLQAIVFPWLPHVGLRMEDLVGDARRKIKSLLRSWTIEEKVPMDLLAWKDVFDVAEWDAMLLKYIVPKLGATLRNDFRVNPRNQELKTIEKVLSWSDIIRPTVFSQILETEFFPKWLDVLHIWLTQPRPNLDEVAKWFSFWKDDTFPKSVSTLPGIERGFTRGLQLMHEALELGPEAPNKLQKPDFRAESEAISRTGVKTPKTSSTTTTTTTRPSAARTHEITFRSIVEEFAAAHNLLFIPTGRAHERSRMPLFKVSPTADGKGGLLVYILDDAVWAAKDEELGSESRDFKAISLEDMVARAS